MYPVESFHFRVKRNPVKFILFLIFIISAMPIAAASATPCESIFVNYLYHVQREMIGRTPSALADFRKENSAVADLMQDKANPDGLYAFESDVFALFSLAPEYRDLGSFGEKWGLTPLQSQQFADYYGSQVFFKDFETIGPPAEMFHRLRQVSREHYLGEPVDALARRWRFYVANLTQYSVPEMARLLNISEGQVYKDLSALQLSVVEAFGKKIAQAKLRLAAKENLDQIAKVLGVGQQALAFVLHHTSVRSRGQSWDDIIRANGRDEIETIVLIRLFGQEKTHQHIADQLNTYRGVGPHDPAFRTAKSVTDKLGALGLTNRVEAGETIIHPQYGLLNESGRLVVGNALAFIIDHMNKDDEWIANALGVQKSTLESFFARHHLVRLSASDNLQFEERTSLVAQYERQRMAIRQVLNWIRATDVFPPTATLV